VIWLPGEPVTTIGRSRFLAVFYHESTPLADGTQQLGYTLYDAASFKILSKGSVSCISKGSSISWVGFSNDCSLMVMDTDGMLSMLIPTSADFENLPNFEWAPVLDTVGMRKSADDQFWPVTVYDGKLVCVPLKGGNQYPDAARRPVTATLGMRMPLARSSVIKK
jgi:chromosome transmission fidelity protein 4